MPLPDAGLGPAGEPLRRRRHARPLRPRARRRRGAARRPATRSRRCSTAPVACRPREPGAASGPLARFPDAGRRTRRASSRCKEYIRAGDAFQIVLSQRAERPTSATALALYRALRRVNPSPYLFLLELDELALVGSSPETHVKLEGSRATLNPIAGTTAAGRRRRRAAARLGEGPRRARDARRPRPQRPLARLPAGHRARRALPRGRALLARHAPRLGGRRRAARRRRRRSTCCARRFPAGTVSGAPKVRAMQIISELEGYRRGSYAGAVGYALPGRRARHVHRDPHDRARTTASRYLQAGGGIVADSDPTAEHEECLNKLAARRARRSTLAEARRMIAAPDRQLRLVHVQPGAPVRGARRGGRGAAERRDHGRGGRAARAVAPRRSPPAPAGPRARACRRRSCGAFAGRVPMLGVCLGHQAIVERLRRRGRAARTARPRQGDRRRATTARGIFAGLPRATSRAGRYHSLAATSVPDVPRGLRDRAPTAR